MALPLVAAVALLVLLPAVSWARAGGGEGYSGGGGGGYGGGGGGDGGGGGGGIVYLIYLLIRLCIEYPLIGIPLVIFIIFLLYQGGQQGNNAYQGNVIRRGTPIIDQQQIDDTVSQIRRHDPNFSAQAFCQRVGNAFLKIQQSWTAQDLTSVRPFISDGVLERFSLQFAEQRDAGYRDVMENVSVQQIRVADLREAGVFDEVAVRVSASAADYRTRLSDGRFLSGSRNVEPLVEIWSFLRKRGAITDLSKTGLIEGNCPNCGAPIEMNESANCQRCKALLRSGEYDWVLSEITQESEWQRRSLDNIPGLARLRQRDPGFDALAMEDRASVIFWRRAAADRTGKIDPLRKVASEEFCQSYAAALAPGPDGLRKIITDCAVGSVSMIGSLDSGDDSPFERTLTEIRWSGKGAAGSVIGRTLFVLGRAPGSQTDSGKSISSAHCPNCGAPESSGTSNACDYCHTVLNDGKHGWILLGLAPMTAPRSQELLSKLRDSAVSSPPTMSGWTNGSPAAQPSQGWRTAQRSTSDAGLLAWAIKEAAADGTVDPTERQVLSEMATQRGVSSDQLNAMIDAALRGEIDVPEPTSRTEAESWLAGMARIALADGKLTREEFGLLRMLGTKFNVGEYDIKMLLKRLRAEQFSQASAALRGRPQPPPPNA
jgi:hypothetical protein